MVALSLMITVIIIQCCDSNTYFHSIIPMYHFTFSFSLILSVGGSVHFANLSAANILKPLTHTQAQKGCFSNAF